MSVGERAPTLDALKPYPAYKDSGVEWIGAIPSHWDFKRVKQVCRMAYGDALATEAREEGEVPIFGSNGPVGTHSRGNTQSPVLIVGRKGSHGKINYSACAVFAIDTTYFIDATTTTANLEWLQYALRLAHLDELSQDTGVPGLNRTVAYSQSLPEPPATEQVTIAAFLDHETARIDALVREQELLLEDLKQKRQATISQAVTKGLNPNVAMKPSGVEWIGDIPQGWDIVRLKSAATIVTARADEKPKHLRYLGLEHMESGTGRLTDTPDPLQVSSIVGLYEPNDVLFGKLRPYLMKVYLADTPGCSSTEIIAFRCNNDTKPRFLKFWLLSHGVISTANMMTFGSKMPRVAPQQLTTLPFPRVPTPDQNAITEYLDQASQAIYKLMQEIQANIDDMKLLRSTLITATITGKVMVPSIEQKLNQQEDFNHSNTYKENIVMPINEQLRIAAYDGDIQAPRIDFYPPNSYCERITLDLPRHLAAHDGIESLEGEESFLRTKLELDSQDAHLQQRINELLAKFVQLLRDTQHERSNDPEEVIRSMNLKLEVGHRSLYDPHNRRIIIAEGISSTPKTHRLWHEACHHIFQSMRTSKTLQEFRNSEIAEEIIVRQATYELCIPLSSLEAAERTYPLLSERSVALAHQRKVSNQLAAKIVTDKYPHTVLAAVIQAGMITSTWRGKNSNPGTPQIRSGSKALQGDTELIAWTQHHPSGVFKQMDIPQASGRAQNGQGRKWNGDIYHDQERQQTVIFCYKRIGRA